VKVQVLHGLQSKERDEAKSEHNNSGLPVASLFWCEIDTD